MNRKYRNTFIAASLMAVLLLTSASAQETNKSKFEPLVIQEQGSFAVGARSLQIPAPSIQSSQRLTARHCMATTPTSSTRFQRIRVSFRSCFCTARGSSRRPGRPLPMAVRAFRRSFFVAGFRFT